MNTAPPAPRPPASTASQPASQGKELSSHQREDPSTSPLSCSASWPARSGPGWCQQIVGVPGDAGHQNRLAQGQELLLDGHQRLADAQARYSRNMTGRFPTHLVSVVCDRTEISALSAALMNTARKDWMSLENLHTEMPLTEDFAQPPLAAFAGRVKCRSIYAAATMDDPSVGIFEMLWERATPLKGHPPAGATGGLTRVQQLVLELR